MNEQNNYHISFFKPTTERARKNRNKVIWLVSIWAIGIFGFHFLLKAIEKPTPEPVLISFNQVWNDVKTGNASEAQIQTFAQNVLQVAGKIFITPEHRTALDNGLSWAVMYLADSAQQVAVTNALNDFEKIAKEVELLDNPEYLQAKNKLSAIASPIIGLQPGDLLAKILPLELRSGLMSEFTAENKKIVNDCMPLYTTHNQSFLTDTKFLGFPFHYFYTAVFLLILFIGICWFYCYATDKINKELQITE